MNSRVETNKRRQALGGRTLGQQTSEQQISERQIPQRHSAPAGTEAASAKFSKTAARKARSGEGFLDPDGASVTHDLQIPSMPLLTAREERRLGAWVRSDFRILESLLLETIPGYRRVLLQLEWSARGQPIIPTWFQWKDRFEKDLLAATEALRDAETLSGSAPRRAQKLIEKGAAVLRRYPLDLERLFQWSRQAAHASPADDPLAGLARPKKALRVLSRAVRRVEASRDGFILPNLRLVLKDVFRFHPVGMRRSDLFQEGILGLHRAAFRYDPARGTRFSTYATYWIRQSIRKALIDRSRLIRVPQAIQEEIRKPVPELPRGEIDRVSKLLRETTSLTAGRGDETDDRPLTDRLSPARVVANENLHVTRIPHVISGALHDLDRREQEVIRRRFGLEGQRAQTLEEIGVQLHLSRERIRQIEVEALGKMHGRHELQDAFERLDAEEPGGLSR